MEKPPLFSPNPEKQPKTSGIDRIVGVGEYEESVLGFFEKTFNTDEKVPWQKESGPELRSIFEDVNVRLKDFLARYGARPLDIPFSSIVLADRSKLTPEQLAHYEKNKVVAEYSGKFQKICIWSDLDGMPKLQQYHVILHEMIHMHSFQSWHRLPEHQKQKPSEYQLGSRDGSERADIDRRRTGFWIRGKRESSYFRDINEAITDELVLRFDREYFKDFPGLAQDLGYRDSFVKAEARRLGVSEDDVIRDFIAVSTHKRENGGMILRFHPASYRKERQRFRELVTELYEKNRDSFGSEEAVFEEFARAAMTGHILPIARLIEKTYGNGSFRLLGEETNKMKQADADTELLPEEGGVGGQAEGV